jgi:hypothetical protein
VLALGSALLHVDPRRCVFAPVAQTERAALGLAQDHAAALIPPHVERMTVKELEEFLLGRAEACR